GPRRRAAARRKYGFDRHASASTSRAGQWKGGKSTRPPGFVKIASGHARKATAISRQQPPRGGPNPPSSYRDRTPRPRSLRRRRRSTPLLPPLGPPPSRRTAAAERNRSQLPRKSAARRRAETSSRSTRLSRA